MLLTINNVYITMFCFNSIVENTSHINILTKVKDILKQFQKSQVINFKLLLKMNNAILTFIFKYLWISSSKILTCNNGAKLIFHEGNVFYILYIFWFNFMNWYWDITCCNMILMSMSTKQFTSDVIYHMISRTPELTNTLLNKITTFLAICDMSV